MRLASIHTYPIKGCRRLDHDGAQVEPWGLAGDRRWMLVDEDGVGVTQRETPALATLRPAVGADGLVLRATNLPDLVLTEPVGGPRIDVRVFQHRAPVPAELAGDGADEWFHAVLDRKVRLVWLGDPTRRATNPDFSEPDDRVSFADGYPLLLTNVASLDVLNGWLRAGGDVEGLLPMTRFRPNVVISGADPWAEDEWLGRRIRVGDVVLRVVKPCARCVVTTIDQETGESGRQPLQVLARHRNLDQGLIFGMYLIPDKAGQIAVGDPVELLP
ncbi:MAG TPA: MOSC N-terminal beta barrel domain-containing protein [Micromonospora sp.]|nr:MOSC N-terminal beta barrel domain-containing protein [Micromonospora sp.]